MLSPRNQSKAERLPLPLGNKGVVDERARADPSPAVVQQLSRCPPGHFHGQYLELDRRFTARNLLINFLILLPATVFVVTLVRLAVLFLALESRLSSPRRLDDILVLTL